MRLRSDQLAAGFVLTAVAILAALAPIQSDTWWLLRAGEDIWHTGNVPLTDAYSHTAAGRYWWNHEWLTEVVFYQAFRVGGLALLTAVAATSIVAAWWLVWLSTAGAFERRLVVYLACIPAAAASWAVRPQALSMLFFVVLCRWLADERRWRWIPLLVLVWIQAHGAAVVALVAIGGVGAAELIRTRRLPWKLMAVWLASFVVTGLTPVGFRLYPEIRASVERSAINELIEWLPPDFQPYLWPFWMVALAVVATLIVRFRSLDARSGRFLAIALITLPLAIRSTRNVHLFLMAAAPALTLAWAQGALSGKHAHERERLNAALMAGVCLAAAVFVGLTWRKPLPHMGWIPISANAVQAIESCEPPLYNTYGDGGVLIWFVRSQRVFIDNRQDPYPTDILRQNKALETSGDHEPAFTQHGIKCAALPPGSPLVKKLEADIRWMTTYRDDQWVIFGRRQ